MWSIEHTKLNQWFLSVHPVEPQMDRVVKPMGAYQTIITVSYCIPLGVLLTQGSLIAPSIPKIIVWLPLSQSYSKLFPVYNIPISSLIKINSCKDHKFLRKSYCQKEWTSWNIVIVIKLSLFFIIIFSNSLIIHEEKAKEVTTFKRVWICDFNYHKVLWTFAMNFFNND